ncbi:MAG: hypothetical protein K8S99_08535 [Planctomycetes bacterium]|nr:hypothetical protein [Planctomycetota bacterium]
MTPVTLIAGLVAYGCHVEARGDNLRVEGPAELLTDGLKAVLTRCKPELMPLLADGGAAAAENAGPDDLPGDWRCAWEERAAIMEFDGDLPRERAEADAMLETLRHMAIEAATGRSNNLDKT